MMKEYFAEATRPLKEQLRANMKHTTEMYANGSDDAALFRLPAGFGLMEPPPSPRP
jgi:hypothetical protein